MSTCWSLAFGSGKKSSMALNFPVYWHLGQMKLPTIVESHISKSCPAKGETSWFTGSFVDVYFRSAIRHGARTCRLNARRTLRKAIFGRFDHPFAIIQRKHRRWGSRKSLAIPLWIFVPIQPVVHLLSVYVRQPAPQQLGKHSSVLNQSFRSLQSTWIEFYGYPALICFEIVVVVEWHMSKNQNKVK